MSTLRINCPSKIRSYYPYNMFYISSSSFKEWDDLYELLKKILIRIFHINNNIEIRLIYKGRKIPYKDMPIYLLKENFWYDLDLFYYNSIYYQCSNCFNSIITENHPCFSTNPDLMKLWNKDTNKCFESKCNYRILYGLQSKHKCGVSPCIKCGELIDWNKRTQHICFRKYRGYIDVLNYETYVFTYCSLCDEDSRHKNRRCCSQCYHRALVNHLLIKQNISTDLVMIILNSLY